MTHLPYVAASYALAIALLVGLGLAARIRLRAAQRILAQIDPRGRREGAP